MGWIFGRLRDTKSNQHQEFPKMRAAEHGSAVMAESKKIVAAEAALREEIFG